MRRNVASYSIAMAMLTFCLASCSGPEATTEPTQDATAAPATATAGTSNEPSPRVERATATLTSPTRSPTPQPLPTVTALPYDSNNAMFRIFAGFDDITGYRPYVPTILKGLEDARANDDRSLVQPIIESSRFQLESEVLASVEQTLHHLTGERFRAIDWKAWSEWIGARRDEFRPPSDYLEWKINYLRRIDERFSLFLAPARDGRVDIDLTEIEWGGVRPDGIPDLNHSPVISADAADYLDDDERVIGIEINGEARAYPLRIINAHELANDTLGGEPIALTW